jgi:hypothetical protein
LDKGRNMHSLGYERGFSEGFRDGQADMRKRLVEYVLSCKEEGVNYVQVYDVMAENMKNFGLLSPSMAPAPEPPNTPDWDADRGDGFNSRGYTAGLGIYHDPMG